jgi:hypothetical protein
MKESGGSLLEFWSFLRFLGAADEQADNCPGLELAGAEIEVEAKGEEVRASNLVGLGEAAHMAGIGMVEVVHSNNLRPYV